MSLASVTTTESDDLSMLSYPNDMVWVAEKLPSSVRAKDKFSLKFFNLYQLEDKEETELGRLLLAKVPEESSFSISNWIFILENLTELRILPFHKIYH